MASDHIVHVVILTEVELQKIDFHFAMLHKHAMLDHLGKMEGGKKQLKANASRLKYALSLQISSNHRPWRVWCAAKKKGRKNIYLTSLTSNNLHITVAVKIIKAGMMQYYYIIILLLLQCSAEFRFPFTCV